MRLFRRPGLRAGLLMGPLLMAACVAPPKDGSAPRAAAGAVAPAVTSEAPAEETNQPVETLLHVRTSELRSRFGDPHAQRRDGGAIVWNYEADGVCRLNLVLQGVRGAPAEVVHAQARMADGTSEATCFDRLRQEARVSAEPVLENVAVAPEPVVAPVRARVRRPPTRPTVRRPAQTIVRPAAGGRARQVTVAPRRGI